MTHEEQRSWLIRYLLSEDRRYEDMGVPEGEQDQKNLLRGLMNVRMPELLPDSFFRIQDEYLTEENRREGITHVADLSPCPSDPRLYVWQGDITTLDCDAIVDACNCKLLGCFRPLHGCVDNIIHSKAGIELRLACNDIMEKQGYDEPTGQAKITPAFNLPCRYVIHTVGPIVQGRLTKRHEELLASCYRSCLELAEKNNVKDIAFCCISTGVFGYPQRKAAETAVETVRKYYEETGSGMKVIFNVFKEDDLKIYQKLVDQFSSDSRL